MPILKRRNDYMKIYRPNGTRYAHGKTLPTAEEAVSSAIVAFNTEFGGHKTSESYIEIIGVTGGWAATMLEIKE